MRKILTALAATAITGLVGCQMHPAAQPANSASVLDVRPVRANTPRFSPPSVVAVPPDEPAVATVYEPKESAAPVRTITPAGRATRLSARKSAVAADRSQQASYKAKKGDTLYHIARAEYGDGKKWTLIASANPGLSPKSLRAGQTLIIP